MSNKPVIHVALLVGSLFVASALLSLASEFRPDGFLGALQTYLSFLFVFPYVLGIALSGSAHSPSKAGAFLGLFAEIYGLSLLAWWIVRRRMRSS